jgi:hypothetical protein
MIATEWEAGKKYFTLGNIRVKTKKSFDEAKRLGLKIEVEEPKAKKVVYMVDLFVEADNDEQAKKVLAKLEKVCGNMATRFEKVEA